MFYINEIYHNVIINAQIEKKNTVSDRRIQEKILKEKQKLKVDRLVFSLNKIV